MPNPAIAAKHQSLRASGLDLGVVQGEEVDSGFGGRMQAYANGRIWWHRNTGAHEVHGAILDEYLRLGGSGIQTASGRRLLAYPISDERHAPDGGARISRFETGAILWGYGTGAVAIHGPFYTAWSSREAALGYPLTPPMPAPAGQQVVACECGALVSANQPNEIVVLEHVGPQMGNPAIVKPDQLALTLFRTRAPTSAELLAWMTTTNPEFLAAALQGRIVLQAVGSKARVALQLTQYIVNAALFRGIEIRASLAPGATLTDRTLYDLAAVRPDGTSAVMRPHAVYAKTEWTRFGAMHATDVHVTARADDFWHELARLGRHESQDAFINFNDAFRALIREANRLHAMGALDVMILTGDLVDYQMEAGQDREDHGGNMLLFERIVRGMSPSPTGRRVEELRVPMFTTLGNHDYRVVPYPLWAKAARLHEIAQYKSWNLLLTDARALQGERRLDISAATALAIVADIRQPPYYHRRINAAGGTGDGENSYVVALGNHRLVMLDSGSDLGVPEDVLQVAFGKMSAEEDFSAAEDGAPNQRGVTTQHIDLLIRAATEARHNILLVGIHGPPLNISGCQFEDYFRETTHPTARKEDVAGYLALRDPNLIDDHWIPFIGGLVSFIAGGFIIGLTYAAVAELARYGANNFDELLKGANRRHPTWIKSIGQRFFSSKSVEDLLNVSASKGRANDLLTLCAGGSVAGKGLAQKVDLVLCGHGHDAVEYRIESEGGAGLLFYTDFYSRTPSEYYGTIRFSTPTEGARIIVHPRAGAIPNAPPNDRAQESAWAGKEWEVEVPPYSDPLDRTGDPRNWWVRHRPLVMQTGAVGPIESRANTRTIPRKPRPDPSFRGFRLISVAGDVIQRIHYRRMVDLDGPPEAWEQWEGARVRLRSVWKPNVVLTLGVSPPVSGLQSRSAGLGVGGAASGRIPDVSVPGSVNAGPSDDFGTGLWRLEPLGDRRFRIREGENHERRSLNVETGPLVRTEAGPGWVSAQWLFSEVGDGSFRIQSVWKLGQFIHIEFGSPATGAIEPGWLSARWRVELA